MNNMADIKPVLQMIIQTSIIKFSFVLPFRKWGSKIPASPPLDFYGTDFLRNASAIVRPVRDIGHSPWCFHKDLSVISNGNYAATAHRCTWRLLWSFIWYGSEFHSLCSGVDHHCPGPAQLPLLMELVSRLLVWLWRTQCSTLLLLCSSGIP